MKTIAALCMGAVLALGLPALAAGSARFTLGPADYDSIAIVWAADRAVARFAAGGPQTSARPGRAPAGGSSRAWPGTAVEAISLDRLRRLLRTRRAP
jgi:hypothetical protein